MEQENIEKKVADDLINNYKLAAIRGNAGEIASLVGINVESKGVDSAGVDNIDEIALAANEKFNIPIVVTGEVDAIAVNGEVVTIHNGSAMMPKSYWDRMLIRCCSSKLYRTRKRSRIEIIRNSNVGLQYRWRNGRKTSKWASSWNI